MSLRTDGLALKDWVGNSLIQETTEGSGVLKSISGLALRYPTPKAVAAAYTLTDNDSYVSVDTTAGAVTVTLPAVAVPGKLYGVIDAGSAGAGNATTNNITVARNGCTIDGAGSNVTISTSGQVATFIGRTATDYTLLSKA